MKPYKIIISVIVCCALISALAAVSAIVGSFAAGQKGPVIDVSPLPEKEAGHFLFPGGEKAGVRRDVFPHPGIYLVPQLGKEQPVLICAGDFFNVRSIHDASGFG